MLSGLLNQETQDERIHRIQVAIKAPVIMHFFFGDNILLFTRENFHGADNIMATLQKYHISYGHVVNLDKSEASFSRNFRDEDKDMVRSRMGVKTVSRHTKYLGFPVVFGKPKQYIFALVIERVWKKTKGWKERFLSRAEK